MRSVFFFALIFCFQIRAENLPVQKIKFSNGTPLLVEVAKTPQQKSQGLMYRTKLDEGRGMLFVFEQEEFLSFWMKNTYVALSIGYFDKNRKLLEITDMLPALGPVRDEQLPHYRSSVPAMYAIEVPRGWFQKKKIKISDRFQFQSH